MKLIDWANKTAGRLCPHYEVISDADDGDRCERLLANCKRSDKRLCLLITKEIEPCTLEDWERCPLKELKE